MASIPPRSTATDDGRLPWLDGGPSEAAGPGSARAGGSWVRWLVGLIVVALVAAAGFLLGRRSEEPPPLATTPLATTPLAPARPAPAIAAPVVDPPLQTEVAPALARVEAERSRSQIAQAPPVLQLRPEQLRAVRQIAEEAEVAGRRNQASRAAVRPAFSPRIAPPGRAVQLGAYRSVAEAEAAAQAFRYKYRGLLATLPKAVLPFRPKSGRRMFYRVQFVTPSQAYAEVTCQRLRAAAKTCLVIY